MKPLIQGGYSFSGFERDVLYLNLGDKRFLDVSGVSGIDSITDGRAAVYADFDNDGDLDVFLTTIQDTAHLLFRNNVGQDAGWIRISLIGTISGRDAFGAVVRIKSRAGIQMRIKTGGEGYLSQHDPRLVFGLGSDARAEWIEVAWPSGRTQRIEDVPAGTSLTITEDEDGFALVTERPSRMPDPIPANENRLRSLTIRPGEPFPEVEVGTLAGKRAPLRSVLPRGKRVLLNLWATWCPTCAREMPELERLQDQLRPIGIAVIGLSLDTDGPKVIEDFVREHGISYPVFQAAGDAVEKIFFRAHEAWVPVTILLDENGTVLEVFSGYAQIIRKLEELTRG